MLFGFDEKIYNKIIDDGIEDIKKGTQITTVVFDPWAYKVLSEKMDVKKVVYFADLLK